jgi:hypothetical protein
MSVIVWLAPVPLAALGAIGWVWWRNRPRGPGDPEETMTAFRRFGSALASRPEDHRRF